MANLVTNEAKASILNGDIDLLTDTIKAMAVTDVYIPDADNIFIDAGGAADAVDARVTGTTDQTLGTKVVGKDNGLDFAYFDAADITFSAVPAGDDIVGIVVYKSTGTATTSKIVGYVDIPDITPNGGDVIIQWAPISLGGVLKLGS